MRALDYESEDYSLDPVSEGIATPQGVYMALGDDRPPLDPLSTPITGETTAAEVEEIRKALVAEQTRIREETER